VSVAAQPVLPFLSREVGADAALFGWLQTTFSFVQLVGGPVIGRVCDTRGARLALLLSQVRPDRPCRVSTRC